MNYVTIFLYEHSYQKYKLEKSMFKLVATHLQLSLQNGEQICAMECTGIEEEKNEAMEAHKQSCHETCTMGREGSINPKLHFSKVKHKTIQTWLCFKLGQIPFILKQKRFILWDRVNTVIIDHIRYSPVMGI